MRLLLAGDIRALHLKRYIEYFRLHGHTTASVSVEIDPEYPVNYSLTTLDLPNFAKYFTALSGFKKIIRDFEPDLINCHFVPNYGMLGALSKFHPLVISAWGSDILVSAQKSVFHQFKAKNILEAADLVLSDADMLTMACQKIGPKIKKALTIPYGVSEKYLILGRHRKPNDGIKFKLASTRQLEPLYRVEDFMRAAGTLSERNKFEISIIGDGSQRDNLHNIASEFDFNDRIFSGPLAHDKLMTALLNSDIYVSCSESDSTSVSLLEAMACGCFPIVSDIAGNREWISDGENGFLFKVGDTAELTKRIESAMSNFDIRKKAIARNFKLIEEKAVWENNMAEVESEFEKLAGKK